MKIKSMMMLVLTAGLLLSCGEREQAAAKVTYDKAVDALVEQVGKADVALELYKKELRQRRENWIKLKQLILTYERRSREATAAAAKYRAAGKENLAVLKEQEAEKFSSRIGLFKEREAKVEEAFKSFQLELEEKKVALQILKDEVATLRSVGNLGSDLMTDESEERLERARALEESIKQDCERAQAALDVNLSSL